MKHNAYTRHTNPALAHAQDPDTSSDTAQRMAKRHPARVGFERTRCSANGASARTDDVVPA